MTGFKNSLIRSGSLAKTDGIGSRIKDPWSGKHYCILRLKNRKRGGGLTFKIMIRDCETARTLRPVIFFLPARPHQIRRAGSKLVIWLLKVACGDYFPPSQYHYGVKEEVSLWFFSYFFNSEIERLSLQRKSLVGLSGDVNIKGITSFPIRSQAHWVTRASVSSESVPLLLCIPALANIRLLI
jgi:hypothetical protein